MVHALETVHRLLVPGGLLVDIHPSTTPATVEVVEGGAARAVGVIREPDGGVEYRLADEALAGLIRRGRFGVERHDIFQFARYADTLEELLENLSDTWQDAFIDAAATARVREALDAGASAVSVREVVRIARLVRLSPPSPAAPAP